MRRLESKLANSKIIKIHFLVIIQSSNSYLYRKAKGFVSKPARSVRISLSRFSLHIKTITIFILFAFLKNFLQNLSGFDLKRLIFIHWKFSLVYFNLCYRRKQYLLFHLLLSAKKKKYFHAVLVNGETFCKIINRDGAVHMCKVGRWLCGYTKIFQK